MTATYKRRLSNLGADPDIEINRTCLKEKILLNCPYLNATKQGSEVLFVVDSDLGEAVLKACIKDSDILCLAKAATIVCKQMFQNSYTFGGAMDRSEQIKSVPAALLSLVHMILEGPSIKDQIAKTELERNAGVTIAQLLAFNSVKYEKKDTHSVRHHRTKETPLPVYIGMKVHSEIRKRELVDRLNNLGLSISYDRLLRISASTANNLCE